MVKKALAVITSLVACLLLLEVAVRVYSAFFFPKMMLLDDRLGWKHASNVKKVFGNEYGERSLVMQNSHGHRGRFYGFTRTNGKYRVLILGDSFGEGVQVSENDLFSILLESLNSDLEVINAAVGGYGTVQEYLYLILEGLKFHPHMVLLMFFENDLSDNCLSYYPGFGPRPYAMINGGEITIVEDLDPTEFVKFILPIPFRTVLNRYSYLYYFLSASVYQRVFSDKMRELQKEDLRKTDSCGKYEIFYGLVKTMLHVLELHGIDFAIALIPTRQDVNLGYSEIHRPILQFCQANRVKCFQLLDGLRVEDKSGENPYFPIDIHWTRAGHRLVAQEILTFLHPMIPPYKASSK